MNSVIRWLRSLPTLLSKSASAREEKLNTDYAVVDAIVKVIRGSRRGQSLVIRARSFDIAGVTALGEWVGGFVVDTEVFKALLSAAKKGVSIQLIEAAPGHLPDLRLKRITGFENVEFRTCLNDTDHDMCWVLVDTDHGVTWRGAGAYAERFSHNPERVLEIRSAFKDVWSTSLARQT